jgi:hypothetical protein
MKGTHMRKPRPLYQSPKDPLPEDEMLAAAKRIRARQQQEAAATQPTVTDDVTRRRIVTATLLRCIADDIEEGRL